MISRKGMSQTLTLIVAASVLMMTALSIIMMVQGGFQDIGKGKDVSACKSQISINCNYKGQSIDTPLSCLNSEGQVKDTVKGSSLRGIDSEKTNCDYYTDNTAGGG